MSMFYTGLTGLSVARSALMTTAHNTANVYTTGYSRQTSVIATNSAIGLASGFVGTGARVTTVARSYDAYLTSQLNGAEASGAALASYNAQISRIDSLLADKTSGLTPLMQSFFAGVQGVANTPADPAARQQLISAAQSLANKFRATDQYLSDLNTSVNEQIQGSVGEINTYAKQIATLNHQIGQMSAVAGGQPPNDLLDQRDQLVNELGKLVDVKVLEQDGGKYNVFIGNGQSLVLGDQAMSLKAGPSAADPTRTALSLVGINGTATELADSVFSGGSIGGLMAFRNETLSTSQNAIGRLAIALTSTFNDQHKLGVDLNGVLGTDFFSKAAPGVFTNAHNTGDMVHRRQHHRPLAAEHQRLLGGGEGRGGHADLLGDAAHRQAGDRQLHHLPHQLRRSEPQRGQRHGPGRRPLPGAAHAHRRARRRRAGARPGQGGRGLAADRRQHRRQPGQRRAGRAHGRRGLPGRAAGGAGDPELRRRGRHAQRLSGDLRRDRDPGRRNVDHLRGRRCRALHRRRLDELRRHHRQDDRRAGRRRHLHHPGRTPAASPTAATRCCWARCRRRPSWTAAPPPSAVPLRSW